MNDNVITLSIDGNEWCALLGDDLATGMCGFGPTRAEAVAALAIDIAEQECTPIGHLFVMPEERR
jgi:hypothetical protein